MKITDIRTLCLSRPHEPERQWRTATIIVAKADAAIVVIDTDEGLRGIGEACAYGEPLRIRAHVDRLKIELLGRDPLEPELSPRPVGFNAPVDTAAAGIDAALWDLRGRILQRPVADLLVNPGKQPLRRVRLYASGGVNYDWEHRPESVLDEALGYAAAGYTAFKMRIGTHWEWAGVTVPRFLALLSQVTEVVGNQMELMLDGNQRLNEQEALVIGRALDEMGWTWFEEPIPQTDVDGYARLNAALNVPVTGGEQLTTVEQFEAYLAKKAYAIVQADGGWCGLTEGMRIARRAWEFGVPMAPHNWHNGLMTMANLHLVASLPFPKVLELNMFQGPLQWDMLRDPPEIRNGYLEVPAAPGLGVELAEDLGERFPYIDGPWGVQLQR